MITTRAPDGANKVSSDKKSKPAGNWNSISYIREKDTHNSGMRKVVEWCMVGFLLWTPSVIWSPLYQMVSHHLLIHALRKSNLDGELGKGSSIFLPISSTHHHNDHDPLSEVIIITMITTKKVSDQCPGAILATWSVLRTNLPALTRTSVSRFLG